MSPARPDREPMLIEPVFVPQSFCQGVASVQVRNGMAHVVLWAEQPECDGPGFDHVMSARLVMPHAVLLDLAARILAMAGDDKPVVPAWSIGAMGGRA